MLANGFGAVWLARRLVPRPRIFCRCRRGRGRMMPGTRRPTPVHGSGAGSDEFQPLARGHGPIRVEDGQPSHSVESQILRPPIRKRGDRKPATSVGSAERPDVRFREGRPSLL